MTEKSEPGVLVLDLWGLPPRPPRDPRGRKSHRWSAEVAKNIALLKVRGETDEAIGLRIGLSVPTLKKYYFRELADAVALVRQAVLAAQLDAAMKGSSSSAKIVLAHLEKAELADEVYRAPASAQAAEPRAAPLGKKEQRQAAAENVGGVYAPGAPPPTLTH